MTKTNPLPSHLTTEETAAAIAALKEAEWIRLRKIAKRFRRNRLLSEDDLLQEAFTRTLAGKRHCPSNIDIIMFLAETMRSIASDSIKALFTDVPNSKPEPDKKPERQLRETKFGDMKTQQADDEEDSLEFEPTDTDPTPEQQLAATQERANIKAKLLGLFNGDDVAQIMIEGALEGMDGEDLRSLTDLDKTGFNSKRRLIRRRIEKAFPGGWTL